MHFGKPYGSNEINLHGMVTFGSPREDNKRYWNSY